MAVPFFSSRENRESKLEAAISAARASLTGRGGGTIPDARWRSIDGEALVVSDSGGGSGGASNGTKAGKHPVWIGKGGGGRAFCGNARLPCYGTVCDIPVFDREPEYAGCHYKCKLTLIRLSQSQIGAQMADGTDRLTEREKEVLRLLGQGFDLKSCASALDISYTSVTERLRSARGKLGVTSSREAARMLSIAEGRPPIFRGDIFSEVERNPIYPPLPDLPDNQVEARVATGENRVREAPSAFLMQPEAFSPLGNLPLRQQGELRNTLSKKQRAFAIVDLAVKLAMVVALICLMALVVNMFENGGR